MTVSANAVHSSPRPSQRAACRSRSVPDRASDDDDRRSRPRRDQGGQCRVREQAGQRPRHDPSADDEEAHRAGRAPSGSPPDADVVERRVDLGEVVVSSWTASGRKLRTTMARPASPKRRTRPRSAPDGRDRASATSSAPTIGSIVTPEDVALHRDRRPDAGQQPPARVARSTMPARHRPARSRSTAR